MEKYALKDVKDNVMRTDTFYPMSDDREDIIAYTYPYHMPSGFDEVT